MNDEKLRELFLDAEPVDEPPLAPGYLESTVTAARQARRRRTLRNTAVGAVAVVAVLGLVGLVVRPYLPDHRTPPASARSAGPLVQRLDAKWMPGGANLHEQSVEDSVQALRYEKWVGTPRDARTIWSVEVSLYPPGVGTAADGPLEDAEFGHGTKVDPVRGMPAELLPDANGYTLEWKYPSGAHAVVTIGGTGGKAGATAGTGFGDRTPSVARRVAENLRIDGTTPMRFPFALHLPANQHVVAADSLVMRAPNGTVSTHASLSFGSGPRVKDSSTVMTSSPAEQGKPQRFAGGNYFVPNRGGFTLQTSVAGHGDGKKLADRVRIVGTPTDPGTWRPDPILN